MGRATSRGRSWDGPDRIEARAEVRTLNTSKIKTMNYNKKKDLLVTQTLRLSLAKSET
jgi:hypothetical protein